jgi:hypothetical protein
VGNRLAIMSRETIRFFDGFNGAKAFVTFGFTVAAMLGLLFGLDLLVGWPFMRASLLFSATMVACAVVLAYLSRNVVRDLQRR